VYVDEVDDQPALGIMEDCEGLSKDQSKAAARRPAPFELLRTSTSIARKR
jgi:hypothetical protein